MGELRMMTIREAIIQDADAIAQISTVSLGYPCQSQLAARRIRDLDKHREKVFVAAEGDLVVGFVHAELYQPLYFEDLVNILGLAVRTDFQRKGCGKLLIQAVERWGKEVNGTAIRLNSSFNRPDAHLFYEKMGFTNTKSQKRFIKDVL